MKGAGLDLSEERLVMRMSLRLGGVIAAAWLGASAAQAAPSPALQAALQNGDFAQAAGLGATAAEVIRAAQAKGRYRDLDPARAEVVIGVDGSILDAYAMRPLPPLKGAGADAKTVAFDGTADGFVGVGAAYILRPAGVGKPERVSLVR
jgi:hypothetical protein